MHESMETPIHDRSAKTGRARKRPMIDLESHAWEFVFFFLFPSLELDLSYYGSE